MIIKELSDAVGVSGAEDEVRAIILKAIKDHVEDIRIDPMGNVLAVKRGARPQAGDLRVMIAAHMDEVGFMVTSIEGDGTLRVSSVGGFDDRILPGKRVVVGEKKVPGVFDWKPIHMNRDQNVVSLGQLRIDLGANGKDEVNGKVKIGDRATFNTEYIERGGMGIGKALDDRVGCAVLVELVQGEPFPFDLHVAFTVQEEIGLRGARVAAQAIEPDVAFVLETTTAHDLPAPDDDPEAPSASPVTELGKGPAITLVDHSVIVDQRLVKHLRETAEAEGIPYQYKRAMSGGTDAGVIFTSGAGVPSATVSVPCRYIHGPQGMCNLDDVAQTVKLVRAALQRLTPDVMAR